MALSPTIPNRANPFDAILKRLHGGSLPANVQSDMDLLKGLDERFDRAKEARRPLEPQWLLNLAFFMGQQWLEWDNAARSLQRPTVPTWRVLAVVNFVKGSVINAFARIIHQRPQAKTQPSDDSPEAEEDARASDKLLEYLWPKTDSRRATDRSLLWSLITGTGIVKFCWDASQGREIGPDPQDPESILHEGEVDVYPVTPFEFYPEPNVEEIKDMTWCFHVTLRSPQWVADHYPKADNGKPYDFEEETYQATDTFESQLRTIINNSEGRSPKGVAVKEYFERPTQKFPEGRFIVYAQDKVLYQGPNPYETKPIPFLAERAQPVPGRFWGDSFVTEMIDAQRNYNKSRSQAIELRNLMARSKWMIPTGSLPPGKVITSAPGEHIVYNPVGTHKPEMVKGTDIPASFFTDQNMSRKELMDLSSQHEITSGMPGMRTALGIAYMQEQDNMKLGPLSSEHTELIERLEEGKLELCKQFYDETRTLRVVGADGRVEVIEFHKEQIPDEVKVHVVAGQALPMSRVARQQFVLQIAQTTLPNGMPLVNDPKVVLKMLEFGEFEDLYKDENAAMRQAERENQLLKAGQEVQARDFHVHPVHIKEHNILRMGEEYEAMAPEQQQIVDEHVQMHQQFVAVQQQGQQPPQPQPQPTPSPEGEDDLFGGGASNVAEHEAMHHPQPQESAPPQPGVTPGARGAQSMIQKIVNETTNPASPQ